MAAGVLRWYGSWRVTGGSGDGRRDYRSSRSRHEQDLGMMTLRVQQHWQQGQAGFGLVASASDVIERVDNLLSHEVDAIGTRRMPSSKGKTQHTVDMQYLGRTCLCDHRTYRHKCTARSH